MPVHSNAANGRVSLRSFLRTRLLLGFYCPIGAPASRCLAWIYCLCLTTLLITAINENCKLLVYVMYMIIEYSANVIISLITGEKYFFNYLKGIVLIDREMGSYLPFITPATGIAHLIIIVQNIAIWSLNFITGTEITKKSLAMMVVLTALNINNLIVTLPFDLLRLRLRLLRQSLEVNLNNSSLNMNNRIAKLQSSLKLYKKMLDNFYSTFNWTKLRIIIALSCNFYAFISNGYRLINKMTKVRYVEPDHEMAGNVLHALDYLFNSLMPCLTLIFSELASYEYEQLKITIGNVLLICDENELRNELELAAEYLELRQFRVTILRVLPVDGSLVVAYLALCTTSLIVIIQTTGLI